METIFTEWRTNDCRKMLSYKDQNDEIRAATPEWDVGISVLRRRNSLEGLRGKQKKKKNEEEEEKKK